MLSAELAHAYVLFSIISAFYADDHLPTRHMATLMNCKWPSWPCENEKQAIYNSRQRACRNLLVENLWSLAKTCLAWCRTLTLEW